MKIQPTRISRQVTCTTRDLVLMCYANHIIKQKQSVFSLATLNVLNTALGASLLYIISFDVGLGFKQLHSTKLRVLILYYKYHPVGLVNQATPFPALHRQTTHSLYHFVVTQTNVITAESTHILHAL